MAVRFGRALFLLRQEPRAGDLRHPRPHPLGERRHRPLHGESGTGPRTSGAALPPRPDPAPAPDPRPLRPPDRLHPPLPGAAEEGEREPKQRHRNRVGPHLAGSRGRGAGGSAPAESGPRGGGESESSPTGRRLRRGRLPDPPRPWSGPPGLSPPPCARGDLRPPPRGRKPRRNPATPAVEPQRSPRRPDPTLSGRSAAEPSPGIGQTDPLPHFETRAPKGPTPRLQRPGNGSAHPTHHQNRPFASLHPTFAESPEHGKGLVGCPSAPVSKKTIPDRRDGGPD